MSNITGSNTELNLVYNLIVVPFMECVANLFTCETPFINGLDKFIDLDGKWYYLYLCHVLLEPDEEIKNRLTNIAKLFNASILEVKLEDKYAYFLKVYPDQLISETDK